MLKLLFVAITIFFTTALADAQIRFDAGIRAGRSSAKMFENENSTVRPLACQNTYSCAFSWGLEGRAGYEFNHGFGLYSGLNFDMVRFKTSHSVLVPNGHPQQSGVTSFDLNYEGRDYHSYGNITVPVLFEYRIFNDIARPYVGYGLSFNVISKDGFFTDSRINGEAVTFRHKTVVPVFIFGISLEYKRFILGFGRRKDQTSFMRDNLSGYTFKSSQNTFKIGYRLF